MSTLRFDRFELDEADARLTCGGIPVPLQPKPFAVLCALAHSPQRLVAKNALLDSVWGHRFVADSVLKTAISDIRAALGDDPKEPKFIETVSRRGYRFICPAVDSSIDEASEVKSAGDVGNAAFAALTALCRGNAAAAHLVRMVAATLEHEHVAVHGS
jgi:DNA-binding winged helix-turn-helix (wHTH) protein